MLLLIQNDPKVPAGILADILHRRGRRYRTWQAFAEEPPAADLRFDGAVLLGGYMGVHDEAAYPFLLRVKAFVRAALARDLPLLGICLGGQLLAEALGAEVHAGVRGESGCSTVELTTAGRADPLFAGLGPTVPVLQWHHDSFELPAGANHLAASMVCPGQAFRYRRAWGLQFHPEVDEAIITAWSLLPGAPPGAAAAFSARQEELRSVAEVLFGNFLTLAAPASELADGRE